MASRSPTRLARAASGTNALLGLWLVISPWIFGYWVGGVNSMWNSVITGALIAAFGIVRWRAPLDYPALSWINLLLGAWTAISPWTFAYVDNGPRMWNGIVVGLAIVALALRSGSATAAYRRDHVHA